MLGARLWLRRTLRLARFANRGVRSVAAGLIRVVPCTFHGGERFLMAPKSSLSAFTVLKVSCPGKPGQCVSLECENQADVGNTSETKAGQEKTYQSKRR